MRIRRAIARLIYPDIFLVVEKSNETFERQTNMLKDLREEVADLRGISLADFEKEYLARLERQRSC
jgi:hypothetical protein